MRIYLSDGTLSCAKCRTPFDVPTLISDFGAEDSATMMGASATPSGYGEPGGSATFEPGSCLGDRYEIVALLGEGAWEPSIKARDRELDRLVALRSFVRTRPANRNILSASSRNSFSAARSRKERDSHL